MKSDAVELRDGIEPPLRSHFRLPTLQVIRHSGVLP